MLAADTPLEGLDWVPRARLAPLRRLGLNTTGDLLRHFPRRYEDRTRFDRFPDDTCETPLCLLGVVRKTAYKRFGPRRVFEALLEDEQAGVLGSPLLCRWFNAPWVQKMIVSGQQIIVFGRPRLRAGKVVMEHPEFEIIDEEAGGSLHFDRITPIHPAGDGINPRALREIIYRAIEETDPASIPVLRPGAAVSGNIWRAVHFPESAREQAEAREELVKEEFFALQLVVCHRHATVRGLGGVSRAGSNATWERVRANLPFRLTASQEHVMGEISADLAAPHRMNRLLQGDVGSGKTLVALRAMLQVAESGWQAALMAPTQLLAEQHFLNFRRILHPLGIPLELQTASRRESVPGRAGMPALVVGTHALLFENAAFARLGLVVIDEQHKFGVLQRSRLIARGEAPDVLVMTATPIPRTLTQTLYGDLDVSVLAEKPSARGRVITALREPKSLPEIIRFLLQQIAEGRQIYIVYPLVEESEKGSIKAATVEYEKWKTHLAPASVGLVHGRMDPGEKEATMGEFREGRIAALVATTVIEVGVDVPNACVMLIEEAGRFGLSQIHQLRGRIGRGPEKSFCILLQDDPSEEAKEKLAILEKTGDGFEIAEADFRLRGPGDMLGTAQAGLPPLRLGDLLRDGGLMEEARDAARALLKADPELSEPCHALQRAFLQAEMERLNVPEA